MQNTVKKQTTAKKKAYVLDTNVLIHDPNAIFNFEEHQVVIPMTVLEELDKLKTANKTIAEDCRQAIRRIDQLVGNADPGDVEKGVPIRREPDSQPRGHIAILFTTPSPETTLYLPNDLNDNRIINAIAEQQKLNPHLTYVLVTKDINMRLKARGCGIRAEDYQNDQLVSDIDLLSKGYVHVEGSFWQQIEKVNTVQEDSRTYHSLPRTGLLEDVFPNQFFIDEEGFIGQVLKVEPNQVQLLDLHSEPMMHQEAWGLTPRDVHQACALQLLLDPNVLLVNITGPAGSGKTILALAAAIEQTVATKQYRRIIATRSTQGIDQDIGYLPGTEAEKMEPWLGAITDNLEALHSDDENTTSSVEYILSKVPLQFKSLNYIRGRSFQHSFIIIDEAQNLTPHQIKTIITRAGNGSKVICLGNLAQIDTAYLNATSSGLTYMTERFKNFTMGGNIQLQGVPRSPLAEYAEAHL